MTLERRHLRLYADSFIHRRDVFAQQTPRSAYFVRRSPVDDGVIRDHISGRKTAAWYALSLDNTIRWIVLDADREDGVEQLQDAWRRLDQRSISSQLELSRANRGHLWVLCEPIAAYVGRQLLLGILPDLPDRIELFPKQDQIRPGQVGSGVRGPLGIHQLTGERYPFVDPVSLKPISATSTGIIEFLAESPRLTALQAAEQLARLLDEARHPPAVRITPPIRELARYRGRLSADQIKDQLGDIRSFVSRYVDLDEAGRGRCPFHEDNRPSFAVHPNGYWICFHEVNPRTGRYLGGDAISFYMRLKGLPFREAMAELDNLAREPGSLSTRSY